MPNPKTYYCPAHNEFFEGYQSYFYHMVIYHDWDVSDYDPSQEDSCDCGMLHGAENCEQDATKDTAPNGGSHHAWATCGGSLAAAVGTYVTLEDAGQEAAVGTYVTLEDLKYGVGHDEKAKDTLVKLVDAGPDKAAADITVMLDGAGHDEAGNVQG